MHLQAPKTVLCIHDLSGLGRCSLSVIVPVLAAMGCQPVALPTAIFSTHTVGLGQPAVQLCQGYGEAALERARMAAFFGVDQLCLSDLSSVADYDNYNLLEGLDAGSSQVQI